MTRAWIATALLACSWLFGLGYYQPANLAVWCLLLVAGVGLLGDIPVSMPPRRHALLAAALMLPAVWLAPLPYKAAPALLAVGLAARALGAPRRWPAWLAQGGLASAAILCGQALALEAYTMVTARAHELPSILTRALAVVTRVSGLETAVDGSWLVIRGPEHVERVGATWDLLLGAGGVCFLAGGVALLALVSDFWLTSGSSPGAPARARLPVRAGLRDIVGLAAVVIAWAPLRASLLIGLWIHRALRADGANEVNVADVFVNSWLDLLLLGALAYAASRVVRRRAPRAADRPRPAVGFGWDAALVAAGVAVGTALVYWQPVGRPLAGRVKVVERHSTWEPTTTPYGTEVYGEAGSYNYAAAYDYCGQYFTMSRLLETDAIDDPTLADCDVLVIKTPTSRYSEDEVAAVVRFVERGGGLLMIGDHTNVFNMNTSLNDVARHFGFTFRNDLLFRVGTPYEQRYRVPLGSSPIIQHVPPMNFAVSCSIDPSASRGRMFIRNVGLYSLPPAYQEMNYHPQAEYRPHMHFGAWCQAWATSHGRGRVLGFADSTLFSNFCVFQPGKAELLRGMLDWLNHRSVWDRTAARLAFAWLAGSVSLVLLAAGAWVGVRRASGWTVAFAAAYAGWAATAVVVIAAHRRALPVPTLKDPWPHVVVERTVSEAPLFTGAFADDKQGLGYGMLEQWIPRIGNRISRATGRAAFDGDGLVIICPTRSVPRWYVERLERYVAEGGRLLVFDSPDVSGSTANSVLWPFGLESSPVEATRNAGALVWTPALEIPSTALLASCRIDGGQPIATIDGTPVAAQTRYGRGLVTAVGFGSLFNDMAMGTHWLPEPEPEVRARYDVLYGLLRASLPFRLRTERVAQGLTNASGD